MSRTLVRTINDEERRRIGARRLASALDRSTGARLRGGSSRGGGGHDADRHRRSGRAGRTSGRTAFDAHQVLPLLAALPEKLGSSNTALCAALASWSVGLVLSLMFLEVVRW